MTRSNHLWPDPAPEVEWEIWDEDTFDRETPQMRDAKGKGLVAGIKALWLRFLLETVRPNGQEGFTRFYFRPQSPIGAPIKGPWEGAVRLRSWIFGTKSWGYRGRLEAADRQLLEAISHIYAQLLLQERSSEPILTLAAEAADRRDFTVKLEEMARPWGIVLDQATLKKARSLNRLVTFEERKKPKIQPYQVIPVKRNRKGRLLPASWKKSLRSVDLRLFLAIGLLIFGLFFLAIAGRQYSLKCTRIESNLVDCVHTGNWLGLITFKRNPVEGLWRARVGQVCNSDGCVSFPTLDTAEGPVKLYDGSSGKSAPQTKIAEQINAYLGDPEAQKFEIVVDFSIEDLLLPAAFILGGFISIASWIIYFLRKPKWRR